MTRITGVGDVECVNESFLKVLHLAIQDEMDATGHKEHPDDMNATRNYVLWEGIQWKLDAIPKCQEHI
jgi:hypothetical protein